MPAQVVDHVSLLLCTCADGTQYKPLFIWKQHGENMTTVAAHQYPDVLEATTENGFMTKEVFIDWLRQFCIYVDGTLLSHQYHLQNTFD